MPLCRPLLALSPPVLALVAALLSSCGTGFRKQRLDQIEDCERSCDPYPVAMWGSEQRR